MELEFNVFEARIDARSSETMLEKPASIASLNTSFVTDERVSKES
jgi:hypothetical protein